MFLTPEQLARERIDAMLLASGWVVGHHALSLSTALAVADGVNGPCDLHLIETAVSAQGATIRAKEQYGLRGRLTRTKRWEQSDEDVSYAATQLDRDVVKPDQIRTVVREFKRAVKQDIHPHRTERLRKNWKAWACPLAKPRGPAFRFKSALVVPPRLRAFRSDPSREMRTQWFQFDPVSRF